MTYGVSKRSVTVTSCYHNRNGTYKISFFFISSKVCCCLMPLQFAVRCVALSKNGKFSVQLLSWMWIKYEVKCVYKYRCWNDSHTHTYTWWLKMMWLQKFIGKVIGERHMPLQRWYSTFCQMVNRIIYHDMLIWWIKTQRPSLMTNQMFFCKMTGCRQISTVVWVMVQPWESTFWPDAPPYPPPHLFFISLSFSCAAVRKTRCL